MAGTRNKIREDRENLLCLGFIIAVGGDVPLFAKTEPVNWLVDKSFLRTETEEIPERHLVEKVPWRMMKHRAWKSLPD